MTAAFGVDGFTDNHVALLRVSGVERVILAFDRDAAGDAGAVRLAEQLRAEGLGCYRLKLPHGMDANDYAMQVTPTSKGLGALIRSAEWTGNGKAPERAPTPDVAAASKTASYLAAKEVTELALTPEPAAPVALLASVEPAAPALSIDCEAGETEIVFPMGTVCYRVRGFDAKTAGVLKVNVLASVANSAGEAFHADTLDLYHAKARANHIARAAAELRVKEEAVKAELGRVLLKLELLQASRGTAAPPANAAGCVQRNHELQCGFTLYGWDGDTLVWESKIADEDGFGARTTHYVYEPGSFVPVAQVVRDDAIELLDQPEYGDYYRKDEDPLWLPPPPAPPIDGLAWYQCDHLGTPQELTDEQSEIAWTVEYGAWGVAKEGIRKASGKAPIANPIRFQGQYHDHETGLHYNRHRYYDPNTARFISKDPIGLEGGFNAYAYVGGNPVSYVDPHGLQIVPYIPSPAPAPGPVTAPFLSGQTSTSNDDFDNCGVAVDPRAKLLSWLHHSGGNPGGDCTPDKLEELQQAKNDACNQPRKCNSNMEKPELFRRMRTKFFVCRCSLSVK
ncbi:RHS repeat-associated core domain-containing protein [Burkholderia aenigmatica]|uniref:RHS repeat-associated core domain-containing protein n=1 Tax=Burkholderia aenigmatica TaxID=2015348 RepID=UPI00264B8147|nr:RHS repeat-associated core domain-containing protein [Burkholderia aenigmatica]MDN7879360.1 RHS repeat-associated core domain-containing protein [Burkholderia aenigmatica]